MKEQIDSIISQTFTEWTLTVRDDGSTDETLKILEQYCKQDHRISLIRGENAGVIQSFYELLKYESADFYFFCDQDDVWLPDKLDIVLKEAEKYDNSVPSLYYNDLKVVDSELNTIDERKIHIHGKIPADQLVHELMRNSVTGCASAINHSLAELWDTTDNIIMHDYYLAQIAAITGRLVFIDEAPQLYRQHGSNVWGITKTRRIDSLVKGEKPIKKFWEEWSIHKNQAKNLLRYKEISNAENWEILNSFLKLNDTGFWRRATFLKKYQSQLVRNNKVSRIIFLFLLLTQWQYKKYSA